MREEVKEKGRKLVFCNSLKNGWNVIAWLVVAAF